MALTAQGDSDVTMDSASTLIRVAYANICKLVHFSLFLSSFTGHSARLLYIS